MSISWAVHLSTTSFYRLQVVAEIPSKNQYIPTFSDMQRRSRYTRRRSEGECKRVDLDFMACTHLLMERIKVGTPAGILSALRCLLRGYCAIEMGISIVGTIG